MKKHGLKYHELEWYLAKFGEYIKIERAKTVVNDIEAKDFIEDQNELIAIGQMLAVERDREKLIQKILMTSLKITGADAGSVFLVVDNKDGTRITSYNVCYTKLLRIPNFTIL